MNMVGEQGKGESVWLGFFLYDVLMQFAKVARLRGDLSFARTLPERGGCNCARTSSSMAGMESGIAAPTLTMARPLGRQVIPNARSIRLRKAGRCSPGRGMPRARAWPWTRWIGASCAGTMR